MFIMFKNIIYILISVHNVLKYNIYTKKLFRKYPEFLKLFFLLLLLF